MAKPIKGNEVIVDKHLQDAIADAEALLKVYDKLDKMMLQLKEHSKGILKGAKGNSVADIQAVTTAYKNSNDAVKASILLDKQLKAADDEVVKGKLRLAEATANQKKLLKEEIALEEKEIGTLKRLSIENSRLTRERQNLNLETKKGADRLKEINTQLDKNNLKIKQSSDLAGKQRLNIGNYTGAVSKLTSALTQLGLGLTVFTALKDITSTIIDQEKATASLSAITGATGDDLTNLKGKITSLANEMKVGITDTTKLFEIVGSQMPQLLQDAEGLQAVSKSSIILSKASGDSIESSTLAMASAMNQFNLGADQAERVMNVLAAGSLVGSAGITDVSDAMKNFGSVAAGANISVEESVALIEVLGKFGVVGAESGTKLRGSVLKLQQANFGYASGQFEVNDALDEAKKKMDSLASAKEKDAFLQKTFGAENISTGRILLSNIGLFEEYTKGVTGTSVATDQARINSDTMSTVVKELGAAWDNLVISWSEGTDVLGGTKAVLRFVADNLESIITFVISGVKAWVLYKSTLTLVNKEGTGMIQMFRNLATGVKGASFNLGTFAKGLGGILGVAVILVPMFIDIVKSIGEMINRTTALDKVTEKYNARMIEEGAKMDLLRIKVLDAIGNKTKMGEVIDEINATYGTTIKNIEDETLVLWQLEKAYKAVNAEMQKKLMKQLLEEELLDLLKSKRELEQEIKKVGPGLLGDALQDTLDNVVIKDINEVQAELFALNQQFGETGRASNAFSRRHSRISATEDTDKKKGETAEQRKARLLKEFRDENELIRKEFETHLIKMGASQEFISNEMTALRAHQYKEELELIKQLGFDTQDELIKTENEISKFFESNSKKMELSKINRIDNFKEEIKQENNFMLDAMVAVQDELAKKRDEELKEEKERLEARKKLAKETIDLVKKVIDFQISELDRKIAAEQNELEASKEKQNYFQAQADAGNTDAAKSVKAEQIEQAKKRLDIESLEKKKRNLLVTITTLELASQKINAGDPNAVQNAGLLIQGLLDKLPKFYYGTEKTVADALGKPHLNASKDAYLARVDGSEMILNKSKVDTLRAAGLTTTSDIANAAMAYSSGLVSTWSNGGGSNGALISKLDEVINAVDRIENPEHQFNFDELNKMAIHTIRENNKITKNHYKTGGLFS